MELCPAVWEREESGKNLRGALDHCNYFSKVFSSASNKAKFSLTNNNSDIQFKCED